MAGNSTSLSNLLPPPIDVDDQHKVYSIAITCIVLGIIGSSFVILRLTQRWMSRTFGPDDWVMVMALLFYLGWTTMAAYVNLHAGVGKPLWEITVGEYSVWFQGIIGSTWLYPAMSASIRTSILLFYRRMFAATIPRLKIITWGLLTAQVLYVIAYSILPAFICRPLYMAWNPLLRPLYFNNWYYYDLQVALYSTSMAFDFILLFLPLWPVMKLQMPLKKRIGVAVMFMLGAAASIIAVWKLAIFVEQMTRFYDINPIWANYEMSELIPPQFDEYGTTFWIPSQLEPTIALIGTSLPALRMLLSKRNASGTARSGGTAGKAFVNTTNPSTRFRSQLSQDSQGLERSGYTELNDHKVRTSRQSS